MVAMAFVGVYVTKMRFGWSEWAFVLVLHTWASAVLRARSPSIPA